MSETEKQENGKKKLEETICLCGNCDSCKLAIERANAITVKMEGRARLRLAERFSENIMKRAVMDAQDHCLIEETTPGEILDYYVAYHEFSLSLIHEAIKTIQIKARRNVANDPKSIAEFKAALEARRAGKGTKKKGLKSKKTETDGTPIVKEARLVKTDSPEEKKIQKGLLVAANSPEMLKMMIPILQSSNPKHDIKAIAKKMGLKVPE